MNCKVGRGEVEPEMNVFHLENVDGSSVPAGSSGRSSPWDWTVFLSSMNDFLISTLHSFTTDNGMTEDMSVNCFEYAEGVVARLCPLTVVNAGLWLASRFTWARYWATSMGGPSRSRSATCSSSGNADRWPVSSSNGPAVYSSRFRFMVCCVRLFS